jgi:hypothetical protein
MHLVFICVIPITFCHTYDQSINQPNINQIKDRNNVQEVEDVRSKGLYFLSIVTILVTVGAIGTTVAIYRHQQNKEGNQTRDTILLEMRESQIYYIL